jgi:signal transduction histidine kinase
VYRNIHFWINIAIIAFIGFIYYDWYERFEWFWYFSIFEFLYNMVGSLFLVPFIYGSIVFRWRGAIFFWLLTFSIALPRMIFLSFHADDLIRNIFQYIVPLLIVGFIALELKWREKQQKMLEQREQERQLYVTQIFQAQETERQRIALELHDGCLQELLIIANRANQLTSNDQNESQREIHECVSWIRDSTMQVTNELRRISLDLRPNLLDNLGLVPALRWLADRLNRESKITTKVLVKGTQKKLGSNTETSIFRITQEALSNIRRHSEATQATISVKFQDNDVKITIEDNGVGFNTRRTRRKLINNGQLGIIDMEERTKSLNGSFHIQSHPGRGTLISIDACIVEQ